ncbi:MAG: DMT family transporter [Flavobacteriales bacterium]|jgi:drug/metabolite transporter (DMT)-like permease|nr:MAG: DMT family transporter [Flavobacteriales bacterium]
MDERARAHLGLFTVNAIYGLNYVVAKGLMPGVIAPGGFILLRVLGASVLFWLLRALRPQRVAWADWSRMLLCAVFGVALNQLMFFHGLMRTSPINASIIMVATPILVLILSGVLIGERISRRKVLGVVLGAIGALALILLRPAGAMAGSTALGDAFILINAASYGLYLVMVKPLMRRYSAVTVMAWCFLIGAFLVLPFGWSDLHAVDWPALTAPALIAMAFVVVMVTFVAYLLNTWALGVVSPSVVGIYIYLQPLLAAFITWLFMRIGPDRFGLTGGYEAALGWHQALCAALIMAGVHLVNAADRER